MMKIDFLRRMKLALKQRSTIDSLHNIIPVSKTVVLGDVRFEYMDESELFSKGLIKPNPITIEEARFLVSKTKQLFDYVGLKFSLAFGTLLGAVRDKGVIPGDEDVDVFVWDEDTLIHNIPLFQQHGLRVVRVERGKLYTFRMNDSTYYIDVYILRELRCSIWSSYCYSLNLNVTPKKFFVEYEQIDFLGIECLCPKRPETLLAFWYGNDWRIPSHDHFFYYEVRSAYYWHHPDQIFKDLLRFILQRKHLRK